MNNHMGAHGVHLPTDAPLPLVASAALSQWLPRLRRKANY
jgi:hypothetical protein